MEEMTIDQEDEQLLHAAAAHLTDPREQECLACFVAYHLSERLLERDESAELQAPARLPDCGRVRLGSTQPCDTWQRRRRRG